MITAQVIGLDALADAAPVVREIVATLPNAEVVRLIVTAYSQPLTESERTLRSALTLLTTQAEQPHRWAILYLLGQNLWKQGRAPEADQLTSQAYEVAVRDQPADSVAVFYASLAMAWKCAAKRQDSQALALALKVDALLERRTTRAPQPHDHVLDRAELGRLWVELGEWERGGKLLSVALADAQFDQISFYDRARVLGGLGLVNVAQNQPEQAIRHLEAALTYWGQAEHSTSDREEIAWLRVRLGDLIAKRTHWHSAAQHFAAAVEDYTAVSASNGRARTLTLLGHALLQQQKLEPSRKALAEAYAFFRKEDVTSSHFALAGALYGQALMLLGEYKVAEEVLTEATEAYERAGLKRETAATFYSLGRAHTLAAKPCDAQHAYQKARSILNDMTEAERAQHQDLSKLIDLYSSIVTCDL